MQQPPHSTHPSNTSEKTRSEEQAPQNVSEEETAASSADTLPETTLIPTEELEKLKAEHAHLKDQLLRSIADTENVRKRGERQLEEASKFAVTHFAKSFIDVFENLYRATDTFPKEALETDTLLKSLFDGIEMTKKSLTTTFEKHGIQRIAPQAGDDFDPNLHQAVLQVESDRYEAGKIVQLMQAGYQLHDRLLRPAIVSVAKPNS